MVSHYNLSIQPLRLVQAAHYAVHLQRRKRQVHNVLRRACAGASFSAAAASTQTIVLANAGNSSVTFNASATPSGLFGGWISMAPSTGMLPGRSSSCVLGIARHFASCSSGSQIFRHLSSHLKVQPCLWTPLFLGNSLVIYLSTINQTAGMSAKLPGIGPVAFGCCGRQHPACSILQCMSRVLSVITP